MADPSDTTGAAGAGAQEPVGSLGQETFKLLRALADDRVGPPPRDSAAASDHQCTTGWCPVCRVVGFVKDNPEVVEEVGAAASHLARTVRDAFDAALRQAAEPRQSPHESDDR